MSALSHPELLALLEGVKEHPSDDDYRLALADWLEEHGQSDCERARAPFIRLQCRRAKLLADTLDYRALTSQPQYQELKAQEESLRRAHLPSWLGVWRAWIARPDNEEWWFQRGLLRPWVAGLPWLEQVGQDPAAWAWVDGLVLLGLGAQEVECLAASPVLEQLNSLDFGPDGWAGPPHPVFSPEGARALAASPYLTRISSLKFTDCEIGPDGARALAESPHFRRLRSLDFSQFDCTPGNEIGDEGVRALAGTVHLATLTHLDLTENLITADGARALAESPHLGGLTCLNLSGNPIGPEGARALASSPFLSRVTRLHVTLTSSPFHSAGDWATRSRMSDAGHLDNLLRELEDAREALRRRFGAAWLES
jgi:uncharacterized protein (TIGR02996 family)